MSRLLTLNLSPARDSTPPESMESYEKSANCHAGHCQAGSVRALWREAAVAARQPCRRPRRRKAAERAGRAEGARCSMKKIAKRTQSRRQESWWFPRLKGKGTQPIRRPDHARPGTGAPARAFASFGDGALSAGSGAGWPAPGRRRPASRSCRAARRSRCRTPRCRPWCRRHRARCRPRRR
jgi:hypothetical protein